MQIVFIDKLLCIVKYIFYLLVEIDSAIPALKCEFLSESTPEEILFISISPFSGLYKVVSYMGKFDI